ncbi:MAG: hypothetical protein AAF078_13380, partial [Planctomycetota bacterium]
MPALTTPRTAAALALAAAAGPALAQSLSQHGDLAVLFVDEGVDVLAERLREGRPGGRGERKGGC